jgi:hypothetical protein
MTATFEQKESQRRYQQRPEIKIKIRNRMREYHQRPEVKERRRLYELRPEVKERVKQYRQRPEVQERMRQYNKQYRKKCNQTLGFKDRERERTNEWRRIQRLKVCKLLGGKCVHCGCDNPLALEINHVNGGGTKEHKTIYSKGGRTPFYRAILIGRRSIKDLELTCRVCNANHFLQRQGITGIIVTWNPSIEREGY